jgi:hypothetical protein
VEKLCQHCSNHWPFTRWTSWRLSCRHDWMAVVRIPTTSEHGLIDIYFLRSFIGQCPPTLLAALLVRWKLPSPRAPQESAESPAEKLERIDFLGSGLLSTTIICFLLVLDLGGQKMPWNSALVLVLASLSLVLGLSFLLVEGYWAKEPVFPLRLLIHRDVLTAYLIAGIQTAAQLGVGWDFHLIGPHSLPRWE